MGIDRRQAIRTAGTLAVAATTVAACDTGTPPPAAPSPSAAHLATHPAEIVHGSRNRPQVAFTFHAQGDGTLIHNLLDALATAGVHATVLAVGSWLAANPDLGRQVLAGGHELGNHTQNHLNINQLPSAKAYTEISSCAEAVRSVSGSIGPWFRPSQAVHASARVRALAGTVGYPTCLSYDVDSLDYTDPPPDTVVRTTLNAVQPGSIVSMHFGHAATISALPRILAGLHTRGLHPVTVTELMRP
ncbi:MAG TPA: polysaccharide deacetylase family protein [Rugosimonospora sp.]|nr:polysaccharide deacetylase family protein [Rugosimonospora sp.]